MASVEDDKKVVKVVNETVALSENVRAIKKVSKYILIVMCFLIGNIVWAFVSPYFIYWPSVIITIAINVAGFYFGGQARSQVKQFFLIFERGGGLK